MGKMKKYLWKIFLRIGHEFIWKADEWFQGQEIKLRKIEGEHEGSNAEYVQNSDHQWNQLPGMGRAFRDRSEVRGAGESLGGRESAGSSDDRSGVADETQRSRSGDERRTRQLRSHLFPGNSTGRKRTKVRVSASMFDDRMRVALAKSRPTLQSV
jgi:hypothetical protein